MKKSTRKTLMILIVLVVGFLFINGNFPFAIFGDEARLTVGSGIWTESKLDRAWVHTIGLNGAGQSGDNYSKSFLSNSDLVIQTRYISKTDGFSGGNPTFGARAERDSSCGTTCCEWEYEGFVNNYYYSLFVDGIRDSEKYGYLNGSIKDDYEYDNRYFDGIDGTIWTDDNPCNSTNLRNWGSDLYNLRCNTGRIISLPSDIPSSGFSEFTLTKNLSSIDYNENKIIHDVKIYAYPNQLQIVLRPETTSQTSCGRSKTAVPNTEPGTYINPSDTVRVNQQKVRALYAWGITTNPEQYFSKMSFMGVSQRTGETYTQSYENGLAYLIYFDVSDFPLIQEMFKKEIYSTQIYIEPKECADNSNFVTKMFTVTGGDVVSKNAVIGEISVPSSAIFCHSIPVLKQRGGVTFEQDYLPYETLQSGGKVTIPSGENWIFFYKGAPTSGNYYFCADNNGIYDEVNNRCAILPAIEYTCVSGVFNYERKSCITQATVEKICVQGVYNTLTDVCEYTPPEQVLCSKGTYNVENNVCIFIPEVNNSCSVGTFNSSTGYCEVIPPVSNICSVGVFNPSKGVCESYPNLSRICSSGSYNPLTDYCEVTPNVVNVCNIGGFDSNRGACVFNPSVELRCETGVLEGDKCIVTPEPVFKEQIDYLFVGMFVLAVVVGVMFFVFKRKRR